MQSLRGISLESVKILIKNAKFFLWMFNRLLKLVFFSLVKVPEFTVNYRGPGTWFKVSFCRTKQSQYQHKISLLRYFRQILY